METDPTKIAQDVFDESLNNSQFGVSAIPYHTHNGTDSTQVSSITSLGTSSTNGLSGDVILAGGTNISITQSGQTITVNTSALATSFDYQVFTAVGSTNWVKPSGATANSEVYVQLWGGGGGAGGANGVASCSGGGGGAEYIECSFRASDLASQVQVVIGDGGAGGVGGGNGSDGSNSTFGAYLVARGGLHSNNGAGSPGGAGAGYFGGPSDSTSLDTFSGGGGGTGVSASNGVNGGNAVRGGAGGGGGSVLGASGNGGTSVLGGTGGTGGSGSAGSAQPGVAPGGGAGGTSSNVGGGSRTGGKGGRGECRIWTFF